MKWCSKSTCLGLACWAAAGIKSGGARVCHDSGGCGGRAAPWEAHTKVCQRWLQREVQSVPVLKTEWAFFKRVSLRACLPECSDPGQCGPRAAGSGPCMAARKACPGRRPDVARAGLRCDPLNVRADRPAASACCLPAHAIRARPARAARIWFPRTDGKGARFGAAVTSGRQSSKAQKGPGCRAGLPRNRAC
jgi:hypothetical protein